MGNSPSESADCPDGVSVDVDVDPHKDIIRDSFSVAPTSQQTVYRVEATVAEKQVQQTSVAPSSKTFQHAQSIPEPRIESVEKLSDQGGKDRVGSEEQVLVARQIDTAFNVQLKFVNDSTSRNGLERKKANLQSMEDETASWPQSVGAQRDKPCTDQGTMPSPTTVSRADGIVSDEQCGNERGRVKLEQRIKQCVEISEAGAPQSHDPSTDDDTKMSHDTSNEEMGRAPSISRETDKCANQYQNTSESTQQAISSLKSVERELETNDKERETETADITGNKETGSTLLGDSPSISESVTTYGEGSQSHPHQPSIDSTLSQPSSTSFTSVGVSCGLTNASLKETGHDGKGHEATFSGTTKEAAPHTKSVEKQLETKNKATSHRIPRPVNMAVKESTLQQLGSQTAGDGDEASQSQLCESSASDAGGVSQDFKGSHRSGMYKYMIAVACAT